MGVAASTVVAPSGPHGGLGGESASESFYVTCGGRRHAGYSSGLCRAKESRAITHALHKVPSRSATAGHAMQRQSLKSLKSLNRR